MPFGIWELLIILVIIIILFGPGRFGKVLGELGSGLRAFRDSLSEKKDEKDEQPTDDKGNIEPK
ncbi:MAG: twin-arginine translocase TatA/TatE family subunit [Anaerolineales bacterium]